MPHSLTNPEYEDDIFLIKQFAKESPLFNSYLQSLIKDIDESVPTSEVWLGTLALGKDKTPTQVKLTISRDPKIFIDEDG
ncbi:hypothetical protein [Thalassotalea marina]|uniref:Uncharacterized protein n=1 Tax=Thalassotalea marina TaxID=1673741 RepID=A0A919BRA1_9GAMM|nr:hypothetical protein [Thalassotalea marina]GHG07229.1 hypothetical protein GCM10017161_41200 [Thalassotalea marina]